MNDSVYNSVSACSSNTDTVSLNCTGTLINLCGFMQNKIQLKSVSLLEET